jgi:23S rRNA (adenine2503-C2)-methyltransferase
MVERQGLSAHQAALAFKGLHRLGLRNVEAIPELSEKAKKYLKTFGPLPTLSINEIHRATDGTVKLRVKTSGGELVESVLIPAQKRLTLCVSSQAGCAAGCTFCHTGTMGLLRNLQAWEILEQVRLAAQFLRDEKREGEITNIVFMGMGEPLHNELNVTQACRILNDDIGPGFSKRHIVVSTVGVGNRIAPFWQQQIASLAISLHATTDEVRDKIVPLNKQWNLAALRKILLEIPWSNRESVTIAYLLLEGVNDTLDDARRLSEWIQGLPAKVNLLEFNPFPECEYKRASPEKLAAFRQWLNDYGVFNTLRQSRGQDAMAACGQLATENKKHKARR